MEKLVRRGAGSGGAHALMSAVLEKHTVSAAAIWQLLLLAQETKPCPLSLLMEEIRREPGAHAFFRAGTVPGTLCLLCPLQRLLSVLPENRALFHSSTSQPIEVRTGSFVQGNGSL